jgi:hypothetical protein
MDAGPIGDAVRMNLGPIRTLVCISFGCDKAPDHDDMDEPAYRYRTCPNDRSSAPFDWGDASASWRSTWVGLDHDDHLDEVCDVPDAGRSLAVVRSVCGLGIRTNLPCTSACSTCSCAFTTSSNGRRCTITGLSVPAASNPRRAVRSSRNQSGCFYVTLEPLERAWSYASFRLLTPARAAGPARADRLGMASLSPRRSDGLG